MPWKECEVLDQRTEFVLKSLGEGVVFRDLCRDYGISTKTGYKWKRRFYAKGLGGLHDLSRRPNLSPSSLSEAITCEIINLKVAHPHWGPHKIHALYQKKFGSAPCESSFKRVLDKAGLVKRRKRRKVNPNQRLTTELSIAAPNDLWTVDFKGWWKMLGGGRCEPLTIRDHFSKYILDIRAMESTKAKFVKPIFEQAFSKYGIPKVILSDNGPPFAVSHALLGLSSLSVWWIASGIRLHRIQPGHPEQNGSHERMHKDISMELQGQIKGKAKEHQYAFDLWRNEYNTERPHETLGMKVPADIYTHSNRKWNGSPCELEYDSSFITRRVTRVGTISIENTKIPISTTLRGWDVGLKYFENEKIEVWFDYLRLGVIDLRTDKFNAVTV